MKRVSVIAVLLAGCSVFGADDAADRATAGGLPPGAPPPLTGTPSDDELTEKYGVFVAADGASDGDGSRARPLPTIGRGIELATPTAKRVYVCNGTYAEALTIVSSVSVIGGFDCANATAWKKTDLRARIESPISPAARAADVTKATRVEGLEIVAPDGASPGASSIGLLATDSPLLTLASCRIEAGTGAAGEASTTPAAATKTAAFNGVTGHIDGLYCPGRPTFVCQNPVLPTAPSGGVGDCGGGVSTESGGAGGSGGVYKAEFFANAWQWRVQGTFSQLGAVAGQARAGTDGPPGQDGASAAAPVGLLSRDGYLPADGTPGGDGSPGLGGAGGNGYPPTPLPSDHPSELWEGVTGGSGGAGGCAGRAGTAGKGGGASIAVVLVASPVKLVGSVLVAKDGGAGGVGSLGASPTVGGTAGFTPNTTFVLPQPPVLAKPGGKGGPAGISGSGAGGPSLALAHTNGVPTREGTSLTVGAPGVGVPETSIVDEAGYARVLPASATGLAAEEYPF